jgi:hypothetical protein
MGDGEDKIPSKISVGEVSQIKKDTTSPSDVSKIPTVLCLGIYALRKPACPRWKERRGENVELENHGTMS